MSYYSGTCLEGTRKIKSQDWEVSWPPDRDLNQDYPEYKLRAAPPCKRCLTSARRVPLFER
jgi:hypothetical protein